MKKILCFIMFCIAVLSFSSCGVSTKTVCKTKSQYSELPKLKQKDLVYLGDVDLEVNYSTYLGFIRPTRSVNGLTFDRRTMMKANLGIKGLNKRFKWATPKILSEYPEACYFQLSFVTKKKNRMFCGKNVTETAKVRCYDIKTYQSKTKESESNSAPKER